MKNYICGTKICLVIIGISVAQVSFADMRFRIGPSKINYSTDVKYSSQSVSASTDYNRAATIGLTVLGETGLYFDASFLSGSGTDARDPVRELTYSHLVFAGGKSFPLDNGMSASIFAGLKGGFTQQTMPDLVNGQVDQYAYNPQGIVLGGGVGFPMPGVGGTVSLNVGIGSIKMRMTRLNGSSNFESSDSRGYSYGASYSYPINDSMGVTLDTKGNSYEYKYGNNSAGLESISEKWTAYSLLFYVNF